ncbi:MAG: phosphoribosylanthranilate isomerase [Chloroflexi bacterium]|nr:phosphoribosylanthranilate isomerase [Chloroflexota bacterium]
MTYVKICGITQLEHARQALAAGADFLGFVFYRPSRRFVDPLLAGEIIARCRAEAAVDRRWLAVGVFVDELVADANTVLETAGLDLAQLCGDEDADYCRALSRPAVRVVRVPPDGAVTRPLRADMLGASRLLLDTQVGGHFGGTGETYPWQAVRHVAEECFLAGGLTPANVGAAITAAAPWGVDVSSGVERDGVKDATLIREFIEEVRRIDAATA